MNAIDAQVARRRASKPTLEERLRRDPEMAQRIDKHLAHLRHEQQHLDAMQHNPSPSEPRGVALGRHRIQHATHERVE